MAYYRERIGTGRVAIWKGERCWIGGEHDDYFILFPQGSSFSLPASRDEVTEVKPTSRERSLVTRRKNESAA